MLPTRRGWLAGGTLVLVAAVAVGLTGRTGLLPDPSATPTPSQATAVPTSGDGAPSSDGSGTQSVLDQSSRPLSAALALDPTPVEVGMRFVAAQPGRIVGLRFFRLSGDSEARPGALWSGEGALIGSATFPVSATTGWQSVALPDPVPLEVGEPYTVSYHASGAYPADVGYFPAAPADPGLAGPAPALHADGQMAGVFTYSPTPVAPTSGAGTNYWVDVDFRAEPAAVPSSAATAPSGGVLPPDVLAQPGQVGFRGDRQSLTVIDGEASAPPGTTWSHDTLRVDADSVTLDGVYVKGSIDYYGAGTLTVRDSVVEANGSSWAVVLSRSPAARVDIRDSTVTWPADVAAPGPVWSNGAVHGEASLTLIRDDISGAPDGVQQSGGNSTFTQNYIHDLRLAGTYPDNTHNDGLQIYQGPNVTVSYNYIELNGYDGTHQNAAVFFSDDGSGTPAPQIVGNYLSGGGYALRLESGTTAATVTGNTFGPVAGGFGRVALSPGASVAVWADNVDQFGSPVSH